MEKNRKTNHMLVPEQANLSICKNIKHKCREFNQYESSSLNIHFQNLITSEILKNLKILVVDNHLDSLALIKTIFEFYKTQVITVKSTSEALQAIIKCQPNILISEIFIPDEDGYSLIRKIRNIKGELGQIPAIALTTLAQDQAVTLALNAGFSTCIAKPFNPDTLIQVVSNLVINQACNLIVPTEESNLVLTP